MKIGLGYDIHPLATGRKFILGGVLLPSDRGPTGHSDGDCLFHAVVDALLGAAGLGDIGKYFPDSDPQWKDADSALFLAETRKMLHKKNFKVENIDVVIHLEKPRLFPHRDQMVSNLARHLDISPERINIKAKSGEGLGEIGRGEAVAAQVIVLLSSK